MFPSLNEYVLGEILSIVHDTSYSTIQSLLLTSSEFHVLTRPLLYHYIGINLFTDSFKEEVQSWLIDPEKSSIPRAIRCISIYARSHSMAVCPSIKVIGDNAPPKTRYDPKARDKASEWSIIAGLISQTTQLQSLTFSCHEAIPLILLQSIHDNPTTIRLNIASWTPGASHADPAELALLGSPSLRSLQMKLVNPERSAEDLSLPAFWRLVRSAPNLQSVKLDIMYGGCLEVENTEEEIQEWKALCSEFERTTLPRADPSSGVRNLKIIGADLSEFDLLQFIAPELLHLTTLDCSQDLPLQVIFSLTSLTHLTLRENDYTRVGGDCLAAFPPLTSLNLVGWRKHHQLDTILTHHGHSLHALGLHEFERDDLVNPREVLTIDELLRIRDGCPHLQLLSIDLNIPENPPSKSDLSTDTHQEVYDTISTFPFLQRLLLYSNLGIASGTVPLVDESFVKRVWVAVNLGRAASSAITELRIAQGEAERPTGYGYPVSWVLWEKETNHWLKATCSERDDEPDKIVISNYRDAPDFTEDLWREDSFF